MSGTSPTTIRFDVGGVVYKLARSTLNLHPTTMLARMADKVWANDDHDPNDAHFIDRNGDRFQYVLDYMRDRQVNLPMTMSKGAFLKEMEYYNFDGVEDSSIFVGTVEDATYLADVVPNHVYEEDERLMTLIKEANKSIEECAFLKETKESIEKWNKWRQGNKAAHALFVRCAGQKETDNRLTVRLAYKEDQVLAYNAMKDADAFEYYLGSYGLKLIAVHSSEGPYRSPCPYSDKYCDFVLERVNKKQEKQNKRKRQKTEN
jgi:hypothetical protein